MTRQEIEENYNVENGIIHSPGKFEGEAIYVLHFWDVTSDGCCEEFYYGEGEPSIFIVEINAEDRAEWPEISDDTFALAMWESESGFVNCNELTKEQLEQARSDYEAEQEETAEED